MSDTGAKDKSTTDKYEFSEITKTVKRVVCLWAHGARSEICEGGPKRKYVLKKRVKERGLCKIDSTAGAPFSRDGPPIFPSNSQSEKNQNAHRLRALKIKLAGASCADTWRLRSERTKKVPRRRLCGQRQKRSW